MPLVGGGGAGNTAGGNPAGIGTSLNYIRDHAYCFSGSVAASTAEQTLLSFSTSSDYIVASLTMTAPIAMTNDIVNGKTRGFQLSFNSQVVGLYKVESTSEDMPSDTEVQILIPPFTAVVLTCIDDSSSVNYLGTANLTGRVYA
jgi:hypothetical protein